VAAIDGKDKAKTPADGEKMQGEPCKPSATVKSVDHVKKSRVRRRVPKKRKLHDLRISFRRK